MTPRIRNWTWALLALLLFYFPFLFGPSRTYLLVLDNLDCGTVYSAIAGFFYTHPAKARHLMLGGNLPVYFLQPLTWPVSLFNLTDHQFLAYTLRDLFVRLTALAGMFLLACELELEEGAAILAGLLFALSLSYTVLGLSIAAIPAVIYLTQQEAQGRGSKSKWALLCFLGWNSGLVFTGIFLIAVLGLLRRILFGPKHFTIVRSYLAYGTGLALGNAGLLYGVGSGMKLHRDVWVLSGFSAIKAVTFFFGNQINLRGWQFYHVSSPLVFLYVSALAAVVLTRNKRLASLILMAMAFNLFYCVMLYDPVEQWRNRTGGLVKTFAFDRFYFMESALVILAWVVAMRVSSPGFRKIMVVAAALQFAWVLYFTPQIYNPVVHMLGRQASPQKYGGVSMTFEDYYKPEDYQLIKSAVGEADTISVGLDPMAAVLAHISALDGYYTAYPLSYKSRFRPVIAAQLKISGQQTYFDEWGSRIYTFSYNPDRGYDSPLQALSLDYCAAYSLGARYVISRPEITDPHLSLRLITPLRGLRLYSIAKCS